MSLDHPFDIVPKTQSHVRHIAVKLIESHLVGPAQVDRVLGEVPLPERAPRAVVVVAYHFLIDAFPVHSQSFVRSVYEMHS